jgi:hypothetical protein
MGQSTLENAGGGAEDEVPLPALEQRRLANVVRNREILRALAVEEVVAQAAASAAGSAAGRDAGKKRGARRAPAVEARGARLLGARTRKQRHKKCARTRP